MSATMFAMVNEAGKFKVVEITNVVDDTFTDVRNNKYNVEKVNYIWRKGKIIGNSKYIAKHLLTEGSSDESNL